MSYSQIIFVLEIIGTIAFSCSGVAIAKKKEMDVFGAIVLGVLTACGGGFIRDITLGRTPPVMFVNPVYAIVAIITALIVFIIEYMYQDKLDKNKKSIDLFLNITDSIGLAVFAVVGVQAGIQSGKGGMFLCVFVGMITAIGGGIMRDIFAMRVPKVLAKRVYGLAAIIGALLYYLLYVKADLTAVAASIVSIAVMLLIRFLAIHYKWNLPSFRNAHHKEQ